MVMRYLGGVNSPPYNPLAANITTGVNTSKDGGVFTASSASQNIPSGQWVDDQYFNQTTLLLQADNVPNAGQNNTVIDSSVNAFTVTRTGDVEQGAFTPYTVPNGYWCNNFSAGSAIGGAITVPSAVATAFAGWGGRTRTLEFFINPPVNQTFALSNIIGFFQNDGTNNRWYVAISSGRGITFGWNGTSLGGTLVGAQQVPLGKWSHIAVVIDSTTTTNTTISLYVNGVRSQTTGVDFSQETGVYTTRTLIAGLVYTNNIDAYNGYISNLRWTSTLVYSGATITVPTSPLTAISGTFYLTCNKPTTTYDTDTTVNTFQTTATTVEARPFSPFNAGQPQYNFVPNVQSVEFQGVGNYAVTASLGAAPIAVTQTTFTIECFMYMTATAGANPTIVGDMQPASTLNYFSFGPNSSNKLVFFWNDGASKSAVGSTTLSLNTWYHIAVSISANAISLYVAGTRETLTGTTTLTNRAGSTNTIAVGQAQSSSFYFTGYISNLSILDGVAKYSGATITVPTAPLPTNTTGQIFLFANQGAVDSNTYAASKTLTTTGAIGNSPLSPFGATDPGVIPYSGGSMYFDGTGDYLTLNGQSQLAFGSNDFSIELWFYFTTLDATNHIIYDSRPTTDGAYPTIYVTNNILIYYVNTAARIQTAAATIQAGQWYHCVVSRVSGTTRMFFNGVAQTPYTDSTVYLNGASRPIIGAAGSGTPGGFLVNGYIAGLKVVNGTGVTSVTVPTAPVTATTNTQLLLSGTNSNIVDYTGKNNFETVGFPRISTAVKKYGSGSIYFDGTTSNYLVGPDNADMRLGVSDFTVEAWINVSSIAAARSVIGKGTTTTGWFLYVATTGKLAFGYTTLTVNGNTALEVGQWYHIAAVRYTTGATNNFRMYINGMLDVSSSITTAFTETTPVYVGADRTGGNNFFGYIDDLRVTKGVARYTANFTPPTVSLPKWS